MKRCLVDTMLKHKRRVPVVSDVAVVHPQNAISSRRCLVPSLDGIPILDLNGLECI